MRFQAIFAAEGEDGLSPIETDKVKSGEISTFKAGLDLTCKIDSEQTKPSEYNTPRHFEGMHRKEIENAHLQNESDT